MDKVIISADDHFKDSFRLATQVFRSGFRPDYIVGIWRGGTPVGIIMHECLAYLGHKADHISVRTSYKGMEFYRADQTANRTRVHNTRYLVERLQSSDKILIVDDVYGSGRSVQAVIERLSKKLRRNMPTEVRIATTYTKPHENNGASQPDFCVREYDQWLVMPYELNGLTDEEIQTHRQGMSLPQRSS